MAWEICVELLLGSSNINFTSTPFMGGVLNEYTGIDSNWNPI
jgi:hypothetical protein